MNIRIGEKIKQLRQRDGRKQEDLAVALKVSPQAVSRWESNGGYPDMDLIPAIANYFNISIDELFGYSRDRQKKLDDILKKADKLLNEQGDMTDCVKMLRLAADEFPSEPKVLIKLGYALNMHGWKCYGARCYTTDGSDYAHEDCEYNSGNIYWQEEIRVFEKVLSMDIPTDDRDTILFMLISVYAQMGQTDKAKALVQKQNSIVCSKELLMPKATNSEGRDRYQGEAIIKLLTELKNVITNSVCTKISCFTQQTGIKIFIDLAKFYESVFSDGRCGTVHYDICELYVHAAVYEARFGSLETAFEYFCKGFEHYKLFQSVLLMDEYQYTAPLVAKVNVKSQSYEKTSDTFWNGWLSVFADGLLKRIKEDSRFAECFE